MVPAEAVLSSETFIASQCYLILHVMHLSHRMQEREASTHNNPGCSKNAGEAEPIWCFLSFLGSN